MEGWLYSLRYFLDDFLQIQRSFSISWVLGFREQAYCFPYLPQWSTCWDCSPHVQLPWPPQQGLCLGSWFSGIFWDSSHGVTAHCSSICSGFMEGVDWGSVRFGQWLWSWPWWRWSPYMMWQPIVVPFGKPGLKRRGGLGKGLGSRWGWERPLSASGCWVKRVEDGQGDTWATWPVSGQDPRRPWTGATGWGSIMGYPFPSKIDN